MSYLRAWLLSVGVLTGVTLAERAWVRGLRPDWSCRCRMRYRKGESWWK